MPSFAMSNEMSMPAEMVMSDAQSSPPHQSAMMNTDCDNEPNCCLGDMSQCISHCHAIANTFTFFTGIELISIGLTSTKASLPLWVSTPSNLSSQNPPPIA
ncbi:MULTISPECIES: hypothetical protein [unclassified Shewanella]|uniref:hypothetical protein n=1 Tax=unclassified Shewanella TaxID=196818 RepID=UPI002175B9ED|nr:MULTISPECIES: hypothetical protein [unclassified Shewanella]